MAHLLARTRMVGTLTRAAATAVVVAVLLLAVPSTPVVGDATIATLRAFKAGGGQDCLGQHLADMTIMESQVGLCLPTPSVMVNAPETPIGSIILTAYESTTGQYSMSTYVDRACQEQYGQTMGLGDQCLTQPQTGFTAVHAQLVPIYQPGQMQITYHQSLSDCSSPLARAQVTPSVCGKIVMPFGYTSQLVTVLDDQSSFNYSLFSDQACGASDGHVLTSYVGHFDECVVSGRTRYAPPNFQIARTPVTTVATTAVASVPMTTRPKSKAGQMSAASAVATLRAYTIDGQKAPPADSCSTAFVEQPIFLDQLGECIATPSMAPLGSYNLYSYDPNSGFYKIGLFTDVECQTFATTAMSVGDECLTRPFLPFDSLQLQLVPTFQSGQWQLEFSRENSTCSGIHAPLTPGVCSGTVIHVDGHIFLSQLAQLLPDGNAYNFTLFNRDQCEGNYLDVWINPLDQCELGSDFSFRVTQSPAMQARPQKRVANRPQSNSNSEPKDTHLIALV